MISCVIVIRKYACNQYIAKNLLDSSISNTMDAKNFSPKELLRWSGICGFNTARFVRNILDTKAGGAAGFFN